MIQKSKKFITACFVVLLMATNTNAIILADDTPPEIESELYILIDARTGHIIHGQGIHQQGYPASMTKVMTALLLLEHGSPMDEIIYHSQSAIDSVVPWHSTIFYHVTENVTVEQALYAIMLRSANDVSNAIAEHVAGSMEAFADMMTARARELGALNTNFVNAHGLWEPEHVTTPYDMALIMQEAIKHEKFLEVISTQRYFFEGDGLEEEDEGEYNLIYNTNSMLFPTSQFFNPDIVGGKTGFTNQSRQTLVSYGQRRDMGLITVVMLADQRPIRYNDTRALMDYGFEQFRQQRLFSAADFELALDLVQRTDEGLLVVGSIDIVPRGNVDLALPIEFDASGVTTRVDVPDRLAVPAARDFVVGQVVLEHNGNVLAEMELVTAQAAEALSIEELVALFPEVNFEGSGTANDSQNSSILNIIVNMALVALGILVAAFIIIRFLQFSRRQRRRTRRRRQNYSVAPRDKKYRYK